MNISRVHHESGLPEYFAVTDRPVKIVETSDDGLNVLAMNITTGEFERDMSYLSRCFEPGRDVDKFTEPEFMEYVEILRNEVKSKAA